MPVKQQTESARRGLGLGVRLRQFTVRLEQPGLYSRLFKASLRLSDREGRHIPMTDIARDGIEARVEEIERELGDK